MVRTWEDRAGKHLLHLVLTGSSSGRMDQLFHRFAACLLVAMLIAEEGISADGSRVALFHIERNKNANIVQYDALLGPDGRLDATEPVVAYWIRLAEQGQKRKLSWVERRFAYGFRFNLTGDKAKLDMAADLGRTIMVERIDDHYRATTEINGRRSYLDRIFIHASGRGLSTRVDYIELHGTDVNKQNQQYERFTP